MILFARLILKKIILIKGKISNNMVQIVYSSFKSKYLEPRELIIFICCSIFLYFQTLMKNSNLQYT